MKRRGVRIATRGSALALWQAQHVQTRLRAAEPGLLVDLVVITTSGDRLAETSPEMPGNKGLFVKEIEEALLEDRADLAVHSMKDVPAVLPRELIVGAVSRREDTRDALVCRAPPEGSFGGRPCDLLPRNARVGTTSQRRQCQLLHRRPDLQVLPLRGNVDTRLRRLEEGAVDALVLAMAGLVRLGLAGRADALFDEGQMLPAVGQGALALEHRRADEDVASLIVAINDLPTAIEIAAERAFSAQLGGDCRTPLAGRAWCHGSRLLLRGLVGAPDGSAIISVERWGSVREPSLLGREVAEALLERGANELLQMPVATTCVIAPSPPACPEPA